MKMINRGNVDKGDGGKREGRGWEGHKKTRTFHCTSTKPYARSLTSDSLQLVRLILALSNPPVLVSLKLLQHLP